MAFDYEAAKAQYGAARARQMAQEAAAGGVMAPPASAISTPTGTRNTNPGGEYGGYMGGVNTQPYPATQPYQYGNVSQYAGPQGQPPNLGNVSAEALGMSPWGTEIGGSNVMTAQMSPEERARWSMEHLEGFDSASNTTRDREGAYNQWMAWQDKYDSSCPPNTPYRGRAGQCAEKPDDCPPGTHVEGTPGTCVPDGQGAQAGGGGGGGGGGFGAGTAGGVPEFNAPRFTAPGYQDMLNDPGYQARLNEGAKLLQHSQAARGMLRTGGSLADLLKYGQDYAANEYANTYNRAANTYGLNYQAAKDEFAPKYGGWQTMYGGDLSRWTTLQNADLSRWTTGQNAALQKYLQRENNIYGVLNQPMPSWGG